jgi:hypothetical protein
MFRTACQPEDVGIKITQDIGPLTGLAAQTKNIRPKMMLPGKEFKV